MVLADDDFATIVVGGRRGPRHLRQPAARRRVPGHGRAGAGRCDRRQPAHRLAATDHPGHGAVGEPRRGEHAHDPAGHRAQARGRALSAAALPFRGHHRPALHVAYRHRLRAQGRRHAGRLRLLHADVHRPARPDDGVHHAGGVRVGAGHRLAIVEGTVTKLGLFTNRSLVVGLVAGAALQWLAVSSISAERILGTDPLGPTEWAIALAVGSTGLLLSSVMTAVERRKSGGDCSA